MHKQIGRTDQFLNFDLSVLSDADLIPYERGVSDKVVSPSLWGRSYNYDALSYNANVYGGFHLYDAETYKTWMDWVAGVTPLTPTMTSLFNTIGSLGPHTDHSPVKSAIIIAIDCKNTVLWSEYSEKSPIVTGDMFVIDISSNHALDAKFGESNFVLQIAFTETYQELVDSLL